MTDSGPGFTLWPSGYEPDGWTMSLNQVERALERYFAEDWVKQGPDYYTASSRRIGREPDSLEFGDLSWAVLLAGRPSADAAQSLFHAAPIDLTSLPKGVALQELEPEDARLDDVVDAVKQLRALKGVAIAVAVKLLHPARPELVPVMDRSSFFGAYFHSRWRLRQDPEGRDPGDAEVLGGLQAVRRVVSDGVNATAWKELDGWVSSKGQGPFTRVQLFDALWWVVHRDPGRVGL